MLPTSGLGQARLGCVLPSSSEGALGTGSELLLGTACLGPCQIHMMKP